MCKSVEEYAERKAAEREKAAEERTELRSVTKIVKNIMSTMNITAEKALELAGIPRADFGKYMALL